MTCNNHWTTKWWYSITGWLELWYLGKVVAENVNWTELVQESVKWLAWYWL